MILENKKLSSCCGAEIHKHHLIKCDEWGYDCVCGNKKVSDCCGATIDEVWKDRKISIDRRESRLRLFCSKCGNSCTPVEAKQEVEHIHCWAAPDFHRCYLCCRKIGSFQCNTPIKHFPIEANAEITKDNWEEHYPIPEAKKEEKKCIYEGDHKCNHGNLTPTAPTPRPAICKDTKHKCGNRKRGDIACATHNPPRPTEGWEERLGNRWHELLDDERAIIGGCECGEEKGLCGERLKSFIAAELAKKDEEIKKQYNRGYQEASEKAGFHFINEVMPAEIARVNIDSRVKGIDLGISSFRTELKEKINHEIEEQEGFAERDIFKNIEDDFIRGRLHGFRRVLYLLDHEI